MSGLTRIEWADRVWNPITGCTKCSPACDNCYAERMSKRLAGRCGYPALDPFRVTLHEDKFNEPVHWRKPARIFVGSMTDLFHPDVPFSWLDQIFATMGLCKRHTFMLLTKRPERMQAFMAQGCQWELPNVWLGTTIWDQASADRAVPLLLSTPAAKRFVSVEPMLGPVDLGQWFERIDHCGACGAENPEQVEDICPACGSQAGLITTWGNDQAERYRSGERYSESPAGEEDLKGQPLDWVICGGETGPGARPMHPDWPRSLRDQCQAAGVSFFFKQWGEWAPGCEEAHKDYTWMTRDGRDWKTLDKVQKKEAGSADVLVRLGKARAGRVLDGQTWEGVPNA